VPDGTVASRERLTSFRGAALALRVVGVGNWGTDRRELRVRGGVNALGGGGAAFVLFDARPEVVSLFLFRVGGGDGD
jgi:hypothetical protein